MRRALFIYGFSIASSAAPLVLFGMGASFPLTLAVLALCGAGLVILGDQLVASFSRSVHNARLRGAAEHLAQAAESSAEAGRIAGGYRDDRGQHERLDALAYAIGYLDAQAAATASRVGGSAPTDVSLDAAVARGEGLFQAARNDTTQRGGDSSHSPKRPLLLERMDRIARLGGRVLRP